MPELIERCVIDYQNQSDVFQKDNIDYQKQYCNIYLKRLNQMTELLQECIQRKWGNTYPVCKLYKLSEENYPKCIVIGTLFKNQKLKPSVLKQLAQGNQLIPQPVITHFTDKSDELFIEDELQRYQIEGCLQGDKLVTGITCALLGIDNEQGKFLVEDYVFADFREQIERPKLNTTAYLVLLSGLDLINSTKFEPNIQMFNCWLSGLIENLDGVETSKIARLIIAGNSVRSVVEETKPSISMLSKQTVSTDTLESVKLLDQLLVTLCQIIDVDLMPGENDPSNCILPQQPMHHCLFPQSAPYKSLNQVSNPYMCSMAGGIKIVGTSGQPITDIMRYSTIACPLEALENCLKWNHLTPTAPDTLGCFPFYEQDPFIIQECPHVFFAGNQPEFATKMCEGPKGQKVRLISIPEFHKTFQVCLLNLQTLDCTTVAFKTL